MGSHRLEAAKTAALKAGEQISHFYKIVQDSGIDVEHKSPGQPVTEADLAANRVIKETLQEFLDAGDGWLSEEDPDTDERFGKEWVWVVDPLDGTRDFIDGNPEFGVSIGLLHNNHPHLGVILNPATGDIFWAEKSFGCYHNGKPVQTLDYSGEGLVEVLASRTEFGRGEWQAYEELVQVNPVGGSAFKLGLVASGQAHGCWTLKPKSEWDICAGHALVEEAGGSISDASGKPLTYNQNKKPLFSSVMYGGLSAYDQMLKILQSAR